MSRWRARAHGSARLRGLPRYAFAPRLSFFFAVGSDFFTEIAKLRAGVRTVREELTGAV